MRFKNHLCPTCGEPADAIVERVEGLCGLEFEADGSADYDDDGMSVDWDTSEPFRSPDDQVTLWCRSCCEGFDTEMVDETETAEACQFRADVLRLLADHLPGYRSTFEDYGAIEYAWVQGRRTAEETADCLAAAADH